MFSAQKKIMGTQIEILIPKNQENSSATRDFEEISGQVFEEFFRIEKIFSRFDPSSELSELNKKKHLQVSPEFFEQMEYALHLSEISQGIFNPLISLSALGYASDFEEKKFSSSQKIEEIFLDWKKISCERKTQAITLPENANLDLGGTIKGYAVDRAKKIIEQYYQNFLINAGGDIFASGKFSPTEKWSIAVANPEHPDNDTKNIFWIELENQALATSGSYKRHWEISGKTTPEIFHHLVSGKTNANIPLTKNPLQSVTITANTCQKADSFATICFLLGEEAGREFCVENDVMGYFY